MKTSCCFSMPTAGLCARGPLLPSHRTTLERLHGRGPPRVRLPRVGIQPDRPRRSHSAGRRLGDVGGRTGACLSLRGAPWLRLGGTRGPTAPAARYPGSPGSAVPVHHQFYEVWQCASLRFLENAFDNAHFAFVHQRTFGQGDQPTPSQYAPWGFDSETIVPVNNPPHAVRITSDPHPVTTRHLRNKWFLPSTRVFHATSPSGRQQLCDTDRRPDHAAVPVALSQRY